MIYLTEKQLLVYFLYTLSKGSFIFLIGNEISKINEYDSGGGGLITILCIDFIETKYKMLKYAHSWLLR